MKKWLIGIIIAVLIIVVAIAGVIYFKSNSKSSNSLGSTNNNQKDQERIVNSDDSKILIAYFSETGNTDKFAQIIHDQIGGYMFKIEPVVAYPKGEAIFDYTKKEQDNDERPEIKDSVNIEEYDTVFIGYPIWWYEVPQIIKTFLDQYDLSGKNVIPFNTHEGSGDGGTYRYISEQEPNANVLEGLPIRGGNMSKDQSKTVRNWLEGLGF